MSRYGSSAQRIGRRAREARLASSLRLNPRLMDELPPDTSHQRVIERMDVRGGALAIFAVAGAAFAVREGAALLAPLLVSVLLAYALEPCVVLLARCRLPR